MNCSLFASISIIALLLCANVQAIDKSACSQPINIGTCHKADGRWFYYSKKNICIALFYSGCGGNDNRFSFKEDCEKLCVKKK